MTKTLVVALLIALAGCASDPNVADSLETPEAEPGATPGAGVVFVDEQGSRHAEASRWFFNVDSGELTQTATSATGLMAVTPLDDPLVFEFAIPAAWVGGSLPYAGYVDVVDVVETATDPVLGDDGTVSTHDVKAELIADGTVVATATVTDLNPFFLYPSGDQNATEALVRISIIPAAPATAVNINWPDSYVVVPTPEKDTAFTEAGVFCFFICAGYLATEHEGVSSDEVSERVVVTGHPNSLVQAAVQPSEEFSNGTIVANYLAIEFGNVYLEEVFEYGYNTHPMWTAHSDGVRFEPRELTPRPTTFGGDLALIGHVGAKEMVLAYGSSEEAAIAFEGEHLHGKAGDLFVLGLEAETINITVGALVASADSTGGEEWYIDANGGSLSLYHDAGVEITVEGDVTINDEAVNGTWEEGGDDPANITIINRGDEPLELQVTKDEEAAAAYRLVQLEQVYGDLATLLQERLGIYL